MLDINDYLTSAFMEQLFSLLGLIPAGLLLAVIAWMVGWFVAWFVSVVRRV